MGKAGIKLKAPRIKLSVARLNIRLSAVDIEGVRATEGISIDII
jgi:hypothetical protein